MRLLVLLLCLLPACAGDTSDFPRDGDDDDSATHDDDDASDDDDAAPDDDDSASDDDDSAGLCDDVDCDDDDPCTADTCDDSTGDCRHATFDGAPSDAFDLPRLRDASTLNLQILSTATVIETVDFVPVSVQVQEVRFDSFEVEGCVEGTVALEGFLALPTARVGLAESTPGVVVAHGLGGAATAASATGTAADLDAVVLAYSGPGQGSSAGTGSSADHVFDAAVDPRNSWFWEHAVAAMRSATLLEATSEVDPDRLGMTGYSAGAVATLMAAGLDDRFVATAPVSGTGHLQLAIDAVPQPGWQADLLAGMNPSRDKSSTEWLNYERWLDPRHFLGTTAADVLLINGTQDEFFPIPSTVATLDDLNATGGDHRLLSIVDWDHGWFALFTGEVAAVDVSNAVNGWLRGRLGTDADLAEVPAQPAVVTLDEALCPLPCTQIEVSIPAVDGYAIQSARFVFGLDGLSYTSWNLQDQGDDTWGAFVGTLDPALRDQVVSFVEVEYGVDFFGLPVAPLFKNTSIPTFPLGFSPAILPTDGPIPP